MFLLTLLVSCSTIHRFLAIALSLVILNFHFSCDDFNVGTNVYPF